MFAAETEYAGICLTKVIDWSRFINGNPINRISDSERQVLKTDWGLHGNYKISPPGQVKLPIQVNANDLQKIYYQDICGNLGKINLKLSFQDVILYYLIGGKKSRGKKKSGEN